LGCAWNNIHRLSPSTATIIQGVTQVDVYTYRGGRGGQDEQKIIWEGGGLKCTPGELWAKYFFSELLKKKILSKSGLHFRAKCCMAELLAMK